MFPQPLHTDRLYLFVIGPGLGETVLLRIPAYGWVVIDSYRHNLVPAASHVLDLYDARWRLLVLTHPHEDHYLGIEQLLEQNADGVVGCVQPRVRDVGADDHSGDPRRHLARGALPVYDAIWQRWGRDPATKWETYAASRLRLGDATITSLNPPQPVPAQDWAGDLNELSSAMLLEWHGLRLLLGADVVNTRWPAICARFRGLSNHAALKVPHHGSAEAVHGGYGGGSPKRPWVVTPYNRGKKLLPAPADGEGLELLLRHVDRLHLTSLPFRHDQEAAAPCSTTREQVRDNTHPVRQSTTGSASLPGGRRGVIPTLGTDPERHVVLEFDARGNLLGEYWGQGSVLVTVSAPTPSATPSYKKRSRHSQFACPFCTRSGCPRPAFVDYKDVSGLGRFLTPQGKLKSRKRTGTCAPYQRALARAVKRARFMGLLPYLGT